MPSQRLPRSRSSWLLIAAALCALAPSPSALAEDLKKPADTTPPSPPPAQAPAGGGALADALTGPARAAYDTAKVLYRAGDFAGALLQFDRAYDLSSEPRLLWNIAVCEKNLRRYARAVKALERLQAEGGTRLSEEDQKDAAYLLKAIRPFVATLTVKVDTPGAAISIDGELAGTSPLASPLLIDMGARQIRITKKGFHEYTKTEQVFGETDISLDVALEREIHQGRLIVVAGKDDVIRLDGKVVGQGTFDGAASSGGHTLRVTAPGMKPYQTEVIVQDNALRRIPITLDPEPKTGVPTWLLVTGSALLAVGAGVGIGYAAFKATEPGDRTRGNLSPYVIELP
jgi:hypothetical protein